MKLKALAKILFLLTVSSNAIAKRSNIEKPAVNFINNYIAAPHPYEWLSTSNLVTASFLSSYQLAIYEGFNNDPELGLGYDPILQAQDSPDSYQVTTCSGSSVTVTGVGMPQFTTTIYLIQIDNIWLIDGAGEINAK